MKDYREVKINVDGENILTIIGKVSEVGVQPEVSRDCAQLFLIISEKDILQKKTYYHVEKLFQTDKFIKYKFADSNYIQVLPVTEFKKKYTVEETL